MEYKILYQDAFPVVQIQLQRGERVKAEYDAMISMSPNFDIDGNIEGGVLSGLGRMLAGEKFFFQTITAARGPGEVLLAPSTIGGIVDVELDGTYNLMVQKDGFLAGTEGINVATKMQNLMQGFFSGEGFFIVKIAGKGTVFLNSYGAIHPINLEDREEVIIDNNHLVAWPDYMDYEITKAARGWVSTFTSGEAVVCRFRGPGTILVQTRNPKSFGSWIKRFIPRSS